ncbi:hypothetical protein EYF80_031969 [Liparis tanakae]|uniref:Uncharacterized protein n=1 Tax=Liparis tanakae TaxID=230148 RepID=A0A4Z2GXE5_9TELE|nr:hypothetical protein EYF80_031969 [Liparis tanakae]
MMLPVLSSRMTMLFQARLCSGFSTVAFLQAFRASMCRSRSAYCHDNRDIKSKHDNRDRPRL